MKHYYLITLITLATSNLSVASENLLNLEKSPTNSNQVVTNNEKTYEISNLSTQEHERFKILMKGIRGIQSPKIVPALALGIEARNDAERRHYAELWVKQEYERTEKEL